MVSLYLNPPPGQDFTHFYSDYMGRVDPMETPAMKRSENTGVIDTPSCWNAGGGVEDPSKKVRKPYTITKSRESWSEQEHDKFLEALHLFDRDWKKIEAFVGSKTVIQIRSHAQKYFLKVQKNGTSEHVPPPRPKRKAAHPYPQKAPKIVASQPKGPLSSAALLDKRPELMPVPQSTIGSGPLYPWTYGGEPTGCVSHMPKDDMGSSGVTTMHNSSTNEIAPRLWNSNETNRQVKQELCREKRVIPDFSEVYGFIGSVFDPSTSGHLQRLKKMDPINVETVLMLMKNLSINLRLAASWDQLRAPFPPANVLTHRHASLAAEISVHHLPVYNCKKGVELESGLNSSDHMSRAIDPV